MMARVLTGSVCGWLAAMHCCSDAKALKALPGARVWARNSSSSGAAAASDDARAAAALQSVASHAMAVLSLAPEADHEFYRRCQVMEKLRPLLKDATDDSETPYHLRHRIVELSNCHDQNSGLADISLRFWRAGPPLDY
eukprot:COSAG01_NODE_915_length_12761_cov_33.161507_6_plen_139_part_00